MNSLSTKTCPWGNPISLLNLSYKICRGSLKKLNKNIATSMKATLISASKTRNLLIKIKAFKLTSTITMHHLCHRLKSLSHWSSRRKMKWRIFNWKWYPRSIRTWFESSLLLKWRDPINKLSIRRIAKLVDSRTKSIN